MKTQYNVTSKVRKVLPNSPAKFASVMTALINNSSPRKRKALYDSSESSLSKYRLSINGNCATSSRKTKVSVSVKRAKRKDCIPISTIKKISTQMPSKRYVTKEGPGYIMNMSLHAAFILFRKQELNCKIAFRKFCMLRPRQVRLLKKNHKESCVCPYCANIRYKLVVLNRLSIESKRLKNEDALVDMLLCEKTDAARFYAHNCVIKMCKVCRDYRKTILNYYKDLNQDRVFKWNHWERVTNEDGKIIRDLIVHSSTVKELLEELIDDYKSKGPFADLCFSEMHINRNYFGSEHGKGECDGEGGTVKSAVDRAIGGRKVVIRSAEMYLYCKENISLDTPGSKRSFAYVTKNEIERDRPNTNVCTLASTRQIHQIQNKQGAYTMLTRNLSCFCANCMNNNSKVCVNKDYTREFVKSTLKVDAKQEKCDDQKDKEKEKLPESKKKKKPTEVKTDKMPALHAEVEDTSSEDYFSRVLEDFKQSASFFELKQKCQKYESKCKDLEVQLPTVIELESFVIDRVSNDMMPFVDQGLPVQVCGDGDCLPKTGSVIAFGSETHPNEIRTRIILELVLHEKLYLDKKHVAKGILNPDIDQEKVINLLSMYSTHYIPGTRITAAYS
ncbi:hypothetical protein KUTeg_022444 [Tegillarca granosa]|uniref:Uncharacterized protein n=1 Tax=Tegillarca granosa TaxID=220873 RepID=A0ABQ9EBP2_TEGGR|nr:hypothetical protein KUTeg_022444 [Tegillarca granosa]